MFYSIAMNVPDIDDVMLQKAREILASEGNDLLISIENNAIILENKEKSANERLSAPFRIGKVLDAARVIKSKSIKKTSYKIGKNAFTPGQNKMNLTPKEEEMVLFLIQAGSSGCHKNDLLKHVWGHNTELETHTLETHIYRLRQKIEDNPNEPKILVTIEKGYKLIFSID